MEETVNNTPMEGAIPRQVKILLLNSLRRGYFEFEDTKKLTKSLGGLVSTTQITADEEIARLKTIIDNPIEVKTSTNKHLFTPAFRALLLKGLKMGYFTKEANETLCDYLGIKNSLTIVIVETREQVEELNRLEDQL